VKIVLRADVDTLGHKGDLVEVAPGYARNYLVPKGLAMMATPGIERQAESMRRSRQVRDRREKEGAEATARQLAAKRVEIKARAGEGGRPRRASSSTGARCRSSPSSRWARTRCRSASTARSRCR